MAMWDGFRTLISFEAAPLIIFPEMSVKPFGLDSRGPIDTTSMRNSRMTTKWPKQLTDLTPVEADVQWTPGNYPTISRLILRINQIVSVTMPTGDILAFYGWLDKAEPQPQKEAEVPILRLTIIPSNVVTVFGFTTESRPTFNGVAF